MSDNTHVATAKFRQEGVHEWQSEQGITDATLIAAALDAQTEATLALAYEQRTANLIALWAMAEPEAAGLACAAGKDRDGVEKDIWNGVATQILGRLGLA